MCPASQQVPSTNRPPGLDLGTSTSAAAEVQEGENVPSMVRNDDGDTMTPSVVGFTPEKIYSGKLARTHAHPRNVIDRNKQLVGRSRLNQGEAESRAYTMEVTSTHIDILAEGPEGHKRWKSPEVASYIIRKYWPAVHAPISYLVIAVLAYFYNTQRRATEDAGKIAGFEYVRLINEPTAAALAMGHKLGLDDAVQYNVLVVDVGSGTCDVTAIQVQGHAFKVCGKAGDNHLGGEDITDVLLKHFSAHWPPFQDVPDRRQRTEELKR